MRRLPAARASPQPAPRRAPGRPTKLTPEVQEQLVQKLLLGLPRRRAAWAIGLDDGTFSRWYRAGAAEGARARFRVFRAAVERAEAEHQEKLLRRATTEERPLSILGRRYPDEWGRRDNVESDDAEKKAADAAAVRAEIIDRLEKLARAHVTQADVPPAPAEPGPPAAQGAPA